MSFDIWVIAQHREGAIQDVSFGLIGEARRIISDIGEDGSVTGIVLGFGLATELNRLGKYGADRVLYVEDESLRHYQGELFANVLVTLVKRETPSCLLTAQTAETSDLCPRVAASLETALVTCAMDLTVDTSRQFYAVRPKANGYLFEHLRLECKDAPIISFLPSVVPAPDRSMARQPEILTEGLPEELNDLHTRIVKVIEADLMELDLEESDIIVAGGRGVGKDKAFDFIHELGEVIGGSVAGTRPVIDWQTLPYDRQIGQTGKTVCPRLIINCGISGANEYTAGMETAQLVVAINTDPRARIFRFADLGIIGDVHEVIPLLISKLKENKKAE